MKNTKIKIGFWSGILSSVSWLISVQSLTRNAMLTNVETLKRIDLQVIAMIEDAGEKLKNKGIKNTGKAIMFGFSSSGSFANRFSILHPELVEMEIAGSPGGWYTLPLASYKGMRLRYQVGVADIEEIAGRSFNKESFRLSSLKSTDKKEERLCQKLVFNFRRILDCQGF